MLFHFFAVFVFLLMAGPVDAIGQDLKTVKEKTSYSVGINIGSNLVRQEADVDFDALALGIQDALSGKEARISEEERQDLIMKVQEELRAKAEARVAALADKNKNEGENFLKENKKKKGVVTLPSGLQYKVIQEGKGKKPKSSDTVTTHYRGTLIDGSEFDSSYKRGEPTSFPVTGVIPGWSEALQLMKVGSKWQLFVPPDLAYGARGAGPLIGPNSTLIFDVELLSIQN